MTDQAEQGITGAGHSASMRGSPAGDLVEAVVAAAWAQVREVLERMGRPERLFQIDPGRTALLVIDMQDAFCLATGCLEISAAQEIAPNINLLATSCREHGIPVFWIRMNLSGTEARAGLWPRIQPRSPVDPNRLEPPTALTHNGSETEVWHGMEIDYERDVVLSKDRYSAFVPACKLHELLQQRRVDTVVITGVGTNVCCESTARDAMMLDYRVVFASDATATTNRLLHETTLMNIRVFFGDVASTAELIDELRRLNSG